MSFTLTGPEFNPDNFGYTQQNSSNLMNSTAKAILFIFKPYQNQFGDVGMRPFLYQFDDNDEFMSRIQEINDLAKRGKTRTGEVVDKLMTETNLNNNLIGSIQPSMRLRSSHLSDRHRFVLMLTEDGSDMITSQTFMSSKPSSMVRRIYTGYFEDEPLNPLTRSPNPHCFMVITHKTVLGSMTEHGRFGPQTDFQTQVSEEVFNPVVARSLMGFNENTDKQLFMMTPENCLNSMEVSDSGYSYMVPGASGDISRDNGANVINDILEQPAHNVAQVVKGVTRYQEDVSNRSKLRTHQAHRYFDDGFLTQSDGRLKMADYMSLPRSKRGNKKFDLDFDQRLSVAQLDSDLGGRLEIVDIDLPRPLYYETADQMEASVVNQYSSMIASVISPILNAAGLNAMSFMYEIVTRMGVPHPNFRTVDAEPLWPNISSDEVISLAKGVEVELINGILDTIYQSKGDFHLVVKANTTGMTVVRLNLVGQGYKTYQDFELPSCLGGLISPLLGDHRSNIHNSESIETLYGLATGTPNVVQSFNDDDREFQRYAEFHTGVMPESNYMDPYGAGDQDQ